MTTEPQPPAFLDQVQSDIPLQPLVKTDNSPSASTILATASAAKNVIMQIAQAALAGGSQAVEIALDPIELGKVRMTLHTSETGINVQILADRPETIDLMRRNAHLLEAEFENLGYQDIGFEFSQNQQNATPQNTGDQTNPTGEGQPLASETAGRQAYPQVLANGSGLDLRL